jgi:ABC-type Zn uptake system ZnuABC Zn-binding protein ZnuA
LNQNTLILALAASALAVTACEPTKKAAPGPDDPKPVPYVMTTTTMINDMANVIAGEDLRVEGIMKPGGDPHLHRPTVSNAKATAVSDLVLTNGLYLEGWLDDLVRNAGGERPVKVVSDGVDPVTMKDMPGGVDPHFWFEIPSWKIAVDNTAAAFVELVPDKKEGIMARADAYKAELDALEAWTRKNLETIPEEQRVLITSHDAFNYFGRAYGIEVVGIQGSSTEQEASQRDVANTIELVRSRNVKAIFIESSVNPKLIEQVARETGVEALGPLYSDSVGAKGSGADTYVGMYARNVEVITKGLGGTFAPLPARE